MIGVLLMGRTAPPDTSSTRSMLRVSMSEFLLLVCGWDARDLAERLDREVDGCADGRRGQEDQGTEQGEPCVSFIVLVLHVRCAPASVPPLHARAYRGGSDLALHHAGGLARHVVLAEELLD